MIKRIFKSIFGVAFLVLFLSLLFIIGVLYNYFGKIHVNEMKNEAKYLAQGVEEKGLNYLNQLTYSDNRITWIDADGTVLFDSVADVANLENHGSREEVSEAFTLGIGQSSRYSDTLSEKTIYYALLLKNGTVLRISYTQTSVFSLLTSLIPPILLILMLSGIISMVFALKLSKSIVNPILDIDLDHPGLTETYDELSPLLRKISVQNQLIKAQLGEMNQRQQEFTTITENMSEGLLVIDNKTDILSYNTSALTLLGTTLTPNMRSVFTLNRSYGFREVVDKALLGEHCEETIFINSRYCRLYSNPVLQDGKIAGAVIVLLDITEKEERDRLRREFSANVSHELKTPLTSISGFAEIIHNGMVRPEDITKFTGNIYDEAKRMIALIDDIIRLSQLDESSFVNEMKDVDLQSITREIVERLKPAAEAKRLRTEVYTEALQVHGVPQVLDEMIYNLCENAIKYNKDNGTLSIELKKVPEGVLFSVADTGCGIPYEDQDRVFERFYRVDKSHSKEIGGTGLGLSIVKHAAMLHSAKITLNSVPGQGTKIEVLFPVTV